ncbi:Uu.00g142590.m01.CDS01 [Anthostomella pinea]|uniref:Translation initiation factor eIF2B subunit epsilon n=1 Tax=Anthostomella pinea TaxID=933095 RepID=A0AAI8VQH8_9PEZI|nr:Uu.00g142590.m01.CDS01 [Anthostomella pinea]
MSQNKRGGAASKGKNSGRATGEEKREDVLQAVVIADAFQTRFMPFAVEKPRCLLPLANTPLIEYTLEFLAMNGVQEVYIYCGAHHEQIERYVHDSRWSPISRSCPFSTVEFIRVADARSIGDFLRDLDKRSLIDGDFILVHGDLVANLSLDAPLAAHRARREANRDSCMTMILREAGEDEHNTKAKVVTPVFVVDPRKKRCLHYEEMNPFQSEHYVGLDPSILEDPEVEARTDLVDAEIDICTPDILALWSESFDYELPRANFLHGVLKDWELNGKMIHTEIVSEGYSARADNLRMYDAITRDILSGWTYPFTPDCNLLKGQTYQLRDDHVYQEEDVIVENSSEISDAVLGRDTQVGSNTTISNSVIGRNCKIGSNVRITDSFIWNDVSIDDGATVEHAVVADMATIGKDATVSEGSLVSFGVQIDDKTQFNTSTFRDAEDDDAETDDLSRLQKSLVYSLEEFDIDGSSVSTLADEDYLSDDDSAASLTPIHPASRSRLSSFASDDSGAPNFPSFHADAVHGLLEVLRGVSGSFDSEKLEFMSLRLANNASDAAMRRAVATAFVRRSVDLMNAEQGGLEPAKAAKQALTSRKGATEFVADVGVGGDSVVEQVEFALAVQRACVSSAKVIEITKAGNLLAAVLQQMYDLDILEEEGIVAWWGDDRGKEGKEGDAMATVRDKCQALVEWLENAEEESEDDE